MANDPGRAAGFRAPRLNMCFQAVGLGDIVAAFKKPVRAAFFAVLVVLAAGCATKPPLDVPLKGIIQAQDDLNPSPDGRSSPLRISIFQLRKVDKFKDADFFALYDDARAVLGGDMIEREDLTLKPGDVRKYEREVDPETRYIGVIGAYRDINQAKWSGYVEMPEKSLLKLMKRDPITITASRLAIDISVGD